MALIDQADQVVFAAFNKNILNGPSDTAEKGVNFDGNTYTDGPLSLSKGGPFSIGGLPAALRPADAFATAHWLRNVGKELFGNVDFQSGITNALVSTGQSKGFQFVSSQVLLASLNPKDPELGFGLPGTGLLNAAWNPTSLVASAVPGTRPTDFSSILAGPVVGAKFDPTTSRIDKYIAEIHKETKVLEGGANAGILGGSQPEDLLSPGIPSRFPTFGTKSFSGFERIRDAVSVLPAIRPKDTPENVNARINDADVDGIIDFGDQPLEDVIYMPLTFQDLRDGDISQGKFLYFRAFIKPDSVTETFTPSWNETKYYGRVDNIPIYMGTSRIIGFSFDVVAFQPADLPVVYRKLHKLQSMVYPFFDNEGFLSAGPIIRMRMGDLFSTMNHGKLGLPGYLTSLDISYDNIWNIEKDFKVPRKATVSISFTVLHEGNPGTYPTSPNGKEFPTFGIGAQDPVEKTFHGEEIGLRGILKNIKNARESRAKPATAGSTNTTPGE